MADNVQIRGIEFEVRGSADKASSSLLRFASNIRRAESSAKSGGLQKLAATMKELATSLGGVDGTGITALSTALNDIKDSDSGIGSVVEKLTALSQLDFSNLTGAAAAIQQISQANINITSPSGGTNDAAADNGSNAAITEKSHRLRDLAETVRGMRSLWYDLANAERAATTGISVEDINHRLMDFSPLKYAAATLFQPIADGLAWLEERLNSSNGTLGSYFSNLANSARTAGESTASLAESLGEGSSELEEIADASTNAESRAAQLAMQLAGRLRSALFSVARGAMKASTSLVSIPFQRAINGAKNLASKISQIGSSFKRIIFYRLIRTAIKDIGQTFEEGAKNAYHFSKQFGSSTKYISEAYDSLSSSGFKMSNQMGAAWATLYAQLAPIINSIIALITRAMQVISQFFAVLGGRGTYLRAIDYTKEWADETAKGSGAAKEWKNQLMGFDEINKLNDPGSGGGGGGLNDDYNNMFDEDAIDARIADFVARIKAKINEGDWYGAGALLAGKIMSIFPTREQWADWGNKLGQYLNGAIQFLYGALDNINFEEIGARIATFINHAFENIDFTYLGALLVRQTTAQIDLWIGGLSTLDWGLVGRSIGDFLRGALDEATSWVRSKDWSDMGHTLYQKFKDLIEGVDFASLAESFFSFLGTAFHAAVDFFGAILTDTWTDISDYFKKKTEECGGDAWEGFKKGIADAVVGIGTWLKTHVIDPFVKAFKEPLGINSPSTLFAGFGGDIIQGFKNGIKDAFSGIASWVDTNITQPFVSAVNGMFNIDWSGVFSGLIAWCQSAHAWIQDVIDGLNLLGNNRGLDSIGGVIGQANARAAGLVPRAEGGFLSSGEIYVARENGLPEMVGTIGGKPAVASNDQITTAIAEAVYGAIVSAMPQGGNNTPIVINLDGREIARTTTKYQNQFARAGG